MISHIKVTFQWSGVHHWPNAEGKHDYLQFTHRHMFKGSAKIQVWDHDREIEFFDVLDFIHDQLSDYRELDGRSCEWVGQDLIMRLLGKYGEQRSVEVEITEDGENGAIILWEPL